MIERDIFKLNSYFLQTEGFSHISCENKNLEKPIKKTISQNEVLIIPEIKGVQRIDTTLNNFCIQEIKSYE